MKRYQKAKTVLKYKNITGRETLLEPITIYSHNHEDSGVFGEVKNTEMNWITHNLVCVTLK